MSCRIEARRENSLNKFGTVGARFHGGAEGRLILYFQHFSFQHFSFYPKGWVKWRVRVEIFWIFSTGSATGDRRYQR